MMLTTLMLLLAAPLMAIAADHNYDIKQGYRYGYEVDLSKEDKARGITALPLVFVAYAGKLNGVYQIIFNDNNDWAENDIRYFECSDTCKFVTNKEIRSVRIPTHRDRRTGEFTHFRTETQAVPGRESVIRVTNGSLYSAIIQDMLRGKLDRYKKNEAVAWVNANQLKKVEAYIRINNNEVVWTRVSPPSQAEIDALAERAANQALGRIIEEKRKQQGVQ